MILGFRRYEKMVLKWRHSICASVQGITGTAEHRLRLVSFSRWACGMKPFKVERTPESSPDVGRKHNFWRSLISDLIYKKKIRELVYNPLRGVLKGIRIRIFDPWFWLHPPCNQPDLIFKPNCCQMYPLDHLALAPAPEGSRNTYLFVCRIDTQIMGVWNKTKKGPLITLGVLIWQLFCFFDTMLLCSIPLFWNK